MQVKLNVTTMLVLVTLMITGCSRGMKSRNINPQTPGESVEPTLPEIDLTEETPEGETTLSPADPTPTDPPIVKDPAVKKDPPVVTNPPVVTTPSTEPNPPMVVRPPLLPPVVKPPVIPFSFYPLIWEKKVDASKDWSTMIYNVIKKEEPFLLGQNVADDIEIFCPAYRKLSEDSRLNFWGQFFAALAYHESGWSPVSRMVEKNFTSKDSVTKMQVVSEGLLQLSYQDEKSYGFDCGFDWNKDKELAAKDPKKTILDPYNNLRCGIKIMSAQLKRLRSITLSRNVYWAVLKTGGANTKIAEISRKTRTLKICQNL